MLTDLEKIDRFVEDIWSQIIDEFGEDEYYIQHVIGALEEFYIKLHIKSHECKKKQDFRI